MPFLIAAPLGLVGLYLRSKLADTPVFRELQKSGEIEQETKTQFRELTRYWRPLLLLMGLVAMLNVTYYTLISYMPVYLQGEIGLTSNKALILVIVGQLIMMTLLPFSGSRIIFRRPCSVAPRLRSTSF